MTSSITISKKQPIEEASKNKEEDSIIISDDGFSISTDEDGFSVSVASSSIFYMRTAPRQNTSSADARHSAMRIIEDDGSCSGSSMHSSASTMSSTVKRASAKKI